MFLIQARTPSPIFTHSQAHSQTLRCSACIGTAVQRCVVASARCTAEELQVRAPTSLDTRSVPLPFLSASHPAAFHPCTTPHHLRLTKRAAPENPTGSTFGGSMRSVRILSTSSARPASISSARIRLHKSASGRSSDFRSSRRALIESEREVGRPALTSHSSRMVGSGESAIKDKTLSPAEDGFEGKSESRRNMATSCRSASFAASGSSPQSSLPQVVSTSGASVTLERSSPSSSSAL